MSLDDQGQEVYVAKTPVAWLEQPTSIPDLVPLSLLSALSSRQIKFSQKIAGKSASIFKAMAGAQPSQRLLGYFTAHA